MADIPINPVTRRVEFTGNTGTGPFAFTFNVLAQADVAAYKNNTLLALTSDYTVSLNSNGTGSITLASALIATDELVIIGDLALSRTTDFVTAGDLLASSLNEQFDSNVVMSQQLDERFDRTIRSQPGDINKNLYLPLVSSRASQLLSFDSSGNITTTSLSNVPDIGTVNLTVSGVASFADGSASAPSITNIGDTNTGMYFGAADQINFSIGGSEVISVASTGTTISGLSISSGDILLTDNSATALEIKEGSNNYLTFITTNGSEKLSFGSTANPTFEVNGSFRQPLIAATTSFFSQTYSGATLSATNGSVNIESYSASKAGIVLNGSGDQITFTSPTLGFVGLVQVVGAITTNTSLNIASSTTVTGILDEDNMASNSATKLATQQSIKAYVDAQVGTVDTLAEVLGNGNTTGGTNIVVSANDVISLDDGTNALPSLTTTGDLNTGIYFPAADEVGITTGGTQRVKVDSTGVNVTGTVTATGTSVFASLDISGDIDVDGTTNLDVVDIDGAVDMASTLTVGGNISLTGATTISNTSGDLTFDVVGDIILDANGGDVRFKDDGTEIGTIYNTSSSLGIASIVQNKDIIFQGFDDSSLITALTLDMSDLGKALFNSGLSITANDMPNVAAASIYHDSSNRLRYAGGTAGHLFVDDTNSTTHLVIDSSGSVGIGCSPTLGKQHTVVSGATGDIAAFGLIGNTNDPVLIIKGDASNQTLTFRAGSSTSTYPAIAFDMGTTGEAMRIDSSGNLLVGKTNTTNLLTTAGHAFYGNGEAFLTRAGTPLFLGRTGSDGSIANFYKDGVSVGSIGVSGGNNLYIGSTASLHAGLTFATREVLPNIDGVTLNDGGTDLGNTSNRFRNLYLSGGLRGDTTFKNNAGTTEYGRFDSSGRLLIAGTSADGSAKLQVDASAAIGQTITYTGTGSAVLADFRNDNGAVGSISVSGTTTAFNTSSDHRLKGNVVGMTGATERLKQLEPKRFNFIADADTTVDGFLAHEVQSVVPEAITGTHNEVDADGNPVYQGIDQSKLVPLLVATIKELEARITALENA